MSKESARKFLERCRDDNEFRNQLASATDQDARWAILKAEGFDFTESEYEAVRSALSDEDLDMVAGGGNSCVSADSCACGNVNLFSPDHRRNCSAGS